MTTDLPRSKYSKRRADEVRSVAVTISLGLISAIFVFGVRSQPAQPDGQTTVATQTIAIPTATPSTEVESADSTMSAASIAEKMVAPPGAPLESTRDSELNTTQTVAPGPGISISPQVAGSEQSTTERLAIKTTADLLRQFHIVVPPAKAPGTSEMDTTVTEAINLSEMLKLVGENPVVLYRVIWENKPLEDPMIVPWVRRAVVLKERFDVALRLLDENRYQEGRDALRAILTEYPDSEYASQAKILLDRLTQLKAPPPPTPKPAATKRAAATPTPMIIKLDANIKVSSVVIDPSNAAENRVMINRRTYRAGEVLRGFPTTRVKEVTDDSVTLEVQQGDMTKDFKVPLREPESGSLQ